MRLSFVLIALLALAATAVAQQSASAVTAGASAQPVQPAVVVRDSDKDGIPEIQLQLDPSQKQEVVRVKSQLGVLDKKGFVHAFFGSLSMIIVSELGDKTFFIAALMAMRHPRMVIYVSALSALALMTVLSSALGYVALVFLPRQYTHYISMVLFLLFGVRLLKEAYEMEPDEENEELEEVQEELKEKRLMSSDSDNPRDLEMGGGGAANTPASKAKKGKQMSWTEMWMSPVFIQCFVMTFVGEWGDRSQITTVIMASAQDPLGITIGGFLGHALCTGIAVLGGQYLSVRISVKTVSYVGGALFLVFAAVAFWQGPESTI